MRALFLSRDFVSSVDGGTVVTKRNYDFLKRFCSEVDCIMKPKSSLLTLGKNILFKEGYGVTNSIKKDFNNLLKQNRYDFVWFDGSCDSSFVELCASMNIPSICFYHNIEHEFYKAKAESTNSILDKIFKRYIDRCERIATQNATFRILLNQRDADLLESLYGKKADLILPTSFDEIDLSQLTKYERPDEEYLLFVGSNFWANIEGISYFINEIAPDIRSIKIKIVGSICDSLKELSLPNNVELLGRVDNLDSYYTNALAVISPILSGSGTKTKTIEALRYGKTIIGSKEALMGVPHEYYDRIGFLCENKSDYIHAINNLGKTKLNSNSLLVFKSIFSTDANYALLNKFLTSIFIGL